ncbi:Integrase core domain-containing protein [Giesbergeria anulus]|uniref:Integrase core domain-containing protein n=1 Tax=Giesbergeria anulus TaxID=180197 RepID=A0A1H9RIJ8_9BURK|nr:Integrase core domain-containing protein [Giesbergeria anulus]
MTTQRDKRQRSAPDLVNRCFVANDINELWVADMTYIPTWAGFLYLAAVLDVYSRKVVGWAFGERMTTG